MVSNVSAGVDIYGVAYTEKKEKPMPEETTECDDSSIDYSSVGPDADVSGTLTRKPHSFVPVHIGTRISY